ncbi:hypothetical protein Tco_0514956 [Tanacetum coccineum]
MEAIEKRYGGNKESKKVQRTLLKQEYKIFVGSSSETMDQTLDRLQKLVSQLEIQGEVIAQEDMNLKLDQQNKPKFIQCGFCIPPTALTSKQQLGATNEADNTLMDQPNSPQLAREDLEQIDPDDLEEMDLQWEMAMMTIRDRRFIKRTCRKAPRNQENKGKENSRRTMTMETLTENAFVAQDGIGGYDWSYQAEEEPPTNFAMMAYTSSGSSSNSDFEVDSSSKSCVKAYATLKEQYDSLYSDYKKS